MKLTRVVEAGKVVSTKIAEASDLERVQRAVLAACRQGKKERLGVEQWVPELSSIEIHLLDKQSMGRLEDANGYLKYACKVECSFNLTKEYGARADGSWANHKRGRVMMSARFEDSSDNQVANFHDIKIIECNFTDLN